jgi:hypothetical protein
MIIRRAEAFLSWVHCAHRYNEHGASKHSEEVDEKLLEIA